MEKNNLRGRPPAPPTREELEEARRRFIAGEEEQRENLQAVKDELLPWNAPYVRSDVKKLFSLRLSEPDMLKLQYINQKTGKSMHQFVLNAVIPAIEAEIKRLTEEE